MSHRGTITNLRQAHAIIGMPILEAAASALEEADEENWELEKKLEAADDHQRESTNLINRLVDALGAALGEPKAAKRAADAIRRGEALEHVLSLIPTPDGGIYWNGASSPEGAKSLLRDERVQGLYIDGFLTDSLKVLVETERLL